MQLALSTPGTRARTALTAVGVALGVALLLGATSVPHALSARSAREDARQPLPGSHRAPLRVLETDTSWRGTGISGMTLQAVSAGAPVPPGLRRLPAGGEMDVSPALAKLLRGPGGAELRRRLHARVVGTIADAGLTGPDDARFYRGSSSLATHPGASSARAFGVSGSSSRSGPVVTLLVIVAVVALLLPVGVFMATAARFGSEDRDRRLAALRLVGADTAMTARVAAGESLLGAAAGLLLGAVIFLAARPLAQHVTIAGVSVFAADVQPSPLLAALVVVLVPLSAVGATLLSIGRIAVEPLGVSRRGSRSRRRLAWRLSGPLLGFALLLALVASHGRLGSAAAEAQAAVGVVLVLTGLTALLPWLIEGLVRRAPDGPLPWLLAVRRLRTEEGTTGRVVGAVGLAVAGAIALQMLFSAAEADRPHASAPATTPGNALVVTLAAPSTGSGLVDVARLGATPGVSSALGVVSAPGNGGTDGVTVAPCPTLARLVVVRRCRSGDSFAIHQLGTVLRPGGRMHVAGGRTVRVPAGTRLVSSRPNAPSLPIDQLLLTPAAARRFGVSARAVTALATVRRGDVRAADRLRDRAAALDLLAQVSVLSTVGGDATLAGLRQAVLAGAIAVLAMIGASLLVAAAEQLRERRQSLAVLAAFGTRSSTIAWSMLCQAAIPVLGALALATVLGAALGTVLAAVVHLHPSYDWGSIGLMVAAGATVVAVVTLLTLPALWRTMQPDALRAE